MKVEYKLTQRVNELLAATTLVDIKFNKPSRLHRLKGINIVKIEEVEDYHGKQKRK